MIELAKDLEKARELGLPMTENYMVFRLYDGDSEAYFSLTQQGKAAVMHIAADRKGKLKLRHFLNSFCELVFSLYEWAEVIMGIVGKKSVVNLGLKCGFQIIQETNSFTIIGRWRQ